MAGLIDLTARYDRSDHTSHLVSHGHTATRIGFLARYQGPDPAATTRAVRLQSRRSGPRSNRRRRRSCRSACMSCPMGLRRYHRCFRCSSVLSYGPAKHQVHRHSRELIRCQRPRKLVELRLSSNSLAVGHVQDGRSLESESASRPPMALLRKTSKGGVAPVSTTTGTFPAPRQSLLRRQSTAHAPKQSRKEWYRSDRCAPGARGQAQGRRDPDDGTL